MTTETKTALEQLRERLQGHARVQVCTLEAKDCAELVLLVDQALDDMRTATAKKIAEECEAMVARSLLRECIDNSPGWKSEWRDRVKQFLLSSAPFDAFSANDLQTRVAAPTIRDMLEIDRLRKSLHRISLASQNSMCSKEECGRIARAALEEA